MLTGEITGISAQPVGFNENQLASRYLFTMTMKVQLTDARTNMVLWSNEALTFREESDLTSRGVTSFQGMISSTRSAAPSIALPATSLARSSRPFSKPSESCLR